MVRRQCPDDARCSEHGAQGDALSMVRQVVRRCSDGGALSMVLRAVL